MGEKLGQHFLDNPGAAEKIADLMKLKNGDNVLEIGPGRGALTSFLVSSGANITGIEIDKELYEIMNSYGYSNLNMENADFLSFDLDSSHFSKICGNVPYQIGGKIVEKIMKSALKWDICVLMLPEAVAARAAALPGSRDYTLLSAVCGAVSSSEVEFNVDPSDFDPPPSIMSSVVSFKRISDPKPEYFYKFISAAFSNRKKKIKNALSIRFAIEPDEAAAIIEDCGGDPSLRVREIDLDLLVRLAEEFVNRQIL